MILGYSNEKHVISPLVGSDLVPYFNIGFKGVTPINRNASPSENLSRIIADNVYTEKDLGTTINSFSVSEKIGEATTFNLSIIDPLGINFVFFNKKYKELLVEWGIKRINPRFTTAIDDEITGTYSRGVFTCVIANIGDIELKDGISTFTTTLRIGTKNFAEPKMRCFNFGTLGSMFKKLCNEIGAKSFIKFSLQDKVLNDDRYFVQNNISNVAFIRQMCISYNLKLVITDGGTVNPLITQIQITDMSYVNDGKTFTGKTNNDGKYHYLDYGNTNSNIIGGKLQTNNNGGVGSTAEMVDGKLVFKASKGEEVNVYTLDAPKVKAILTAEGARGGVSTQAELVQQMIDSTPEDLYGSGGLYETYFKSEKCTTYPEGEGFTCSFDVVANPLFNLNDRVWLGLRKKQIKSTNTFVNRNFKNPDETSGISEKFRTNPTDDGTIKKTLWHFTSIEQSITTDGYRMNVEIAR